MSLFCWTQRKIFWRMWETEQFWGTIDFHSIFFPTMEINGAPNQPGYKLSSKYIPLCSAEQRNSYRFGTTWGWVNDDRIFIFGWTIPLNVSIWQVNSGGYLVSASLWYLPPSSGTGGRSLCSTKCQIKGIVHPKIVIIYSPSRRSTYVSFLCWTQRRYFEEPNSCWSPFTSIVVTEIL